jgi:hypothetical protein
VSTVEALQALDSSLELSPYSQLSVSGLRTGFETLLDTPVPDIALEAVTATIDALVSSTVLAAMNSVTSVPLVGTLLGFAVAVVSALAGQGDLEQAHEDQQRRECAENARRYVPINTGPGGKVVPADLLASYLDWSDPERVVPPEVRAQGGGRPPSIGMALWTAGYGYPRIAELAETLRKKRYGQQNRALKVLRAQALRELGTDGPTDQRRRQFRLVAEAIALSRDRPESDGGVSLWPVLLDVLRSQEDRTPGAYLHFLATHDVNGSADPPEIYETLEECKNGAALKAVVEIRRDWGLTIDPMYAPDRAKAEELKRQIDATVRARLKPKVRFVLRDLERRGVNARQLREVVQPKRWPWAAAGAAACATGAAVVAWALRRRARAQG